MDGAVALHRAAQIILPLLAPGLVATALFTFISSWNEFFFALVLIQSPERETLPLTLANFVGAEGQVAARPARRRLAAGDDPEPRLLRRHPAPADLRAAERSRQGMTRHDRSPIRPRSRKATDRMTENQRPIIRRHRRRGTRRGDDRRGGTGGRVRRERRRSRSRASPSRRPPSPRPTRSSPPGTRPTRTSRSSYARAAGTTSTTSSSPSSPGGTRAGHHPRRVRRHHRASPSRATSPTSRRTSSEELMADVSEGVWQAVTTPTGRSSPRRR